MGDLLFYLMTHYRDTDIRDKARFYYMLITSATDEKASVGISVEPKMYSTETVISNMYLKMYSKMYSTETVILNTDSFTCFMQHNSCSFLGQVLAHFIMMGFNFFQICMIIQPTTDSHFFHTEAISTLLPNNKAKGHSNVKELEKSILSLEK